MNYNALEWLNQNMYSNYPIVDSCVVKSTTGEYLPSSLIVDASIIIPPIADSQASSRFFISHVDRAGDGFHIAISYNPPQSAPFVCARTSRIPTNITAGDPVMERTFALTPSEQIPENYNSLYKLQGSIIIGTGIDILSKGSYQFEYDNAALLSTRIFQTLVGLKQVQVQDAQGGVLETFSDNFIIRAGDGIELAITEGTIPGSSEPLKTLEITRVETQAEALADYRTVADVKAAVELMLGNPIKRVNGVAPDATGNINIVGADCTNIDSTVSGLSISNPCSKPCCGESSTKDISAAIHAYEDITARLVNYFEAIANNVNAMQSRLASLIASRR